MQFVEPSVTPIPSGCDSSPTSLLRVIERAYRICYRSEGNMKDGSEELIGRILYNIPNGKAIHSSPLEHRRIMLSCNSWIASAIGRWQKERSTAFIRILPNNETNSVHSHILEGNFRAFFDFVSECYNSLHSTTRDITTYESAYLHRAQLTVNHELNHHFPIVFKETENTNQYSVVDCNDIKYIGESKDYMSFHVVTTRDVLQEIARNRTISPNVESTRYCNYNKKGMCFCIPRPYEWTTNIEWTDNLSDYIERTTRPFTVANSKDETATVVDVSTGEETERVIHSETRIYHEVSAKTIIDNASSMLELYMLMTSTSEAAYNKAIELGCKPEEARMLLLGGLKTEMILTGRMSDWARFLKLRNAPEAHPQIRYIAKQIDKWFLDRLASK